MKNNYVSTGKPKIAHANKNKNKKNSLIPSLHISLGTIMNNNNTFIIVGNQSLSKSKSKSRSKSKSSFGKYNSRKFLVILCAVKQDLHSKYPIAPQRRCNLNHQYHKVSVITLIL